MRYFYWTETRQYKQKEGIYIRQKHHALGPLIIEFQVYYNHKLDKRKFILIK